MESKVKILNKSRTQNEPPLLAFQFTAIVGQKSAGKSYTSMKIYKQFKKECSENLYDFENPFEITKSHFTHQFYIAPTADIDLTLKNDKLFKNFVLLKPDMIDETAEYIMEMQKNYNAVQPYIEELIYFQPSNYKSVRIASSVLLSIIKIIEKMKIDYPELIRQVPKGPISDKVQQLYKSVQMSFDGSLFQRPKIYLILDDIGSEKAVSGSQVNNPLFSLAKGARHYSVYSAVYIAHSLSFLYGQLRGQFNCFILKKGLNDKQLKDLFDDYLGLKEHNFDKQDFIEIYDDWTGKEQNSLGYNSLYILNQPYSIMYFDDGKKWFELSQ